MRSNKSSRRRYTRQYDRKRWVTYGALLVASAATLGYLIGCYSERYKKKRSIFSLFFKNNNHNDKADNMHVEYKRDYRILIYGDSTTWGYCPDLQNRLSSAYRYPDILSKELNENQLQNKYLISVITCGLNGRTINEDDYNISRKITMNGTAQILPILYSHKPLDIIIIMLGINDCKERFNLTSSLIGNNMNNMIKLCLNAEIWTNKYKPQIILISPPRINTLTKNNKLFGMNNKSILISSLLNKEYKQIVNLNKNYMYFIDSNKYIKTGSDSVHINGLNNIKLAKILKPLIKNIINKYQSKSKLIPISLTDGTLNQNQNQNQNLNYIEEDTMEDTDDSLSELEQVRNADNIVGKDKPINNT